MEIGHECKSIKPAVSVLLGLLDPSCKIRAALANKAQCLFGKC
jgi:hypothetical protein